MFSSQQSPKGYQNGWVSKWQVFLFLSGARLCWYPFRLGASFRGTQRFIKTDGHQNGKFFQFFEKLTFWYPFVLVPVWVPPILWDCHSPLESF